MWYRRISVMIVGIFFMLNMNVVSADKVTIGLVLPLVQDKLQGNELSAHDLRRFENRIMYLERRLENGSLTVEELDDTYQILDSLVNDPDPYAVVKILNGKGVVLGKVTTKLDDLNIRKSMSTKSLVIDKAKRDTVLVILEDMERKRWYRIQTQNGIEGFAHSDFVTILTAENSNTFKPLSMVYGYGIVATRCERCLNIRQFATKESASLGAVARGTKLRILSEYEEWYEVGFNGKRGFVHSDYFTVLNTDIDTVIPSDSIIYGVVTTKSKSLRIRQAASKNSKVIGGAIKGSRLRILSEHDAEWYEVEFNGKRGFASKRYVVIE